MWQTIANEQLAFLLHIREAVWVLIQRPSILKLFMIFLSSSRKIWDSTLKQGMTVSFYIPHPTILSYTGWMWNVQTLWMCSMYQNKKISSYKHGSAGTSRPSYWSERLHLKDMLKMCYMRSNIYLGMSYHGLPNSFKDLGTAADNLSGVHNGYSTSSCSTLQAVICTAFNSAAIYLTLTRGFSSTQSRTRSIPGVWMDLPLPRLTARGLNVPVPL
jgi:hypothetical protein